MSDEVVISNEDLDLSDAELSRPLLDKLVLCRVAECKTTLQDGRKQKVIKLVTEQSTTATNGRELNPGFIAFHRINLDVQGNRTIEMIKEQLARFQVAALKLDRPTSWGQDSQYVGALLKVKFKTRADRDDSTKLYQDVSTMSKAD